MKFFRFGLVLLSASVCLAGLATAKPWWLRGADTNQNDFLPPDKAFRVSARVEGAQIRVRWIIADGYYLYRQKMDVEAESPDLLMSPPNFPPGMTKTDAYLGTQEIFKQQVEGTAAFTRSDAGAHSLEIKVTYQGCAEAGLCYPPISKVIFPSGGGVSGAHGVPGPAGGPVRVAALAHSWVGWAIMGGGLAFFLAGLSLRKGRRLALPV